MPDTVCPSAPVPMRSSHPFSRPILVAPPLLFGALLASMAMLLWDTQVTAAASLWFAPLGVALAAVLPGLYLFVRWIWRWNSMHVEALQGDDTVAWFYSLTLVAFTFVMCVMWSTGQTPWYAFGYAIAGSVLALMGTHPLRLYHGEQGDYPEEQRQ